MTAGRGSPRTTGFARGLPVLLAAIMVAGGLGLVAPVAVGSAGHLAAPLGPPSLLGPAGPTIVGRSPSPSSASLATSATPLAPPPAISCQMYPNYVWVTNGEAALAPPMPAFGEQSPCYVIDPSGGTGGAFHDEVHATLTSEASGSASRVRFPVHLPPTGATVNPGTVFGAYSVGTVVSGDAASAWNQSYAAIYLAPNVSSNTYNVLASVWSLLTNYTSTSCNGLNFTWNGSYACEAELLGGGTGQLLQSNVTGGGWVNITFVGTPRSTTKGLTMYFNDTAQSIHDTVVLNAATTGGPTLAPAFSSACAFYCILNWSMGFGLGYSADLCDYTFIVGCFSFNETAMNLTVPIAFGAPHYVNASGAYRGDYASLGFESASGVCAGGGPTQNTIACSLYEQTGYYPFFTFNGTELDLGNQKSYATENWGGAQRQFPVTAGAAFQTPFFLDRLNNDSRAGFIGPSSALEVTVRAQVFGNVTGVYLNYTLPNGQGGNVSMSRVNGTISNGYWNGTIPSTGGNGRITYRIWAIDVAGVLLADPNIYERPLSVQRGTVPLFTLQLLNDPSLCGSMTVNGTQYPLGTNLSLLAGFYAISSRSCNPYVFGSWSTSPGLTVTGGNPGRLTLSATGTVTAVWRYVRPFDFVRLAFSPPGCGTIALNGSAYTTPATVPLLDWFNFSLAQTPCGLYTFSGWTVSNATNLSILGSVLTPHGNGTLTATYIPSSQALTVVFDTLPRSCGGILFRGAGYTDNTSLGLLANTAYPIHQLPCAHYGFERFTTQPAGAIALSAGTITAASGGIVTEVNYHLTEVTVLTNPGWCGGVRWDGLGPYANATLLNVTNNTEHTVTATACSGYYFVGFQGSGGVAVVGNVVTVNGSGSLTVNFQRGVPHTWVGFITSPTGCGQIVFNGVAYINSNYNYTAPFSVASLVALPCSGFGFVAWVTTGGIAVAGSIAYVNGSGSIKAVFHALALLYVQTSPANCGAVLLAGQSYANGAQVSIPIDDAVPLAALPCANYGLAAWQNTTDAILYHGTMTLTATAILKAVFVALKYPVTFVISPANCGGIVLGRQEFFNNSTTPLIAGSYPLSPKACAGTYVTGWNTTGNLSVATSGLLTVGGPGTVRVTFGPVPPNVTLEGPPSSYTGSSILFQAAVAVPVPPYTYNYTWTFGDGSSATTPGNFTTHSYAQAGLYLVRVSVLDPYGRTAQANLSLRVVAAPPTGSFSLTLTDDALLGVVAAVLVATALLALRRPRRPAEGPAEEAPTAYLPDDGGAAGGATPNVQEKERLTLDAPPEELSNPEDPGS
jgi:PKD domain/Divergent InlB B-repeat domain